MLALRFTQRLADTSVALSTGSAGDSFDNALAENLWSTIKTELIYWPGNTFVTRAEADATIFRYIDGWYNPRRIQQGLGGLSPDEYEATASPFPRPGRLARRGGRVQGARRASRQRPAPAPHLTRPERRGRSTTEGTTSPHHR